jgi:hypothetical protein
MMLYDYKEDQMIIKRKPHRRYSISKIVEPKVKIGLETNDFVVPLFKAGELGDINVPNFAQTNKYKGDRNNFGIFSQGSKRVTV